MVGTEDHELTTKLFALFEKQQANAERKLISEVEGQWREFGKIRSYVTVH